MKFIVDAQLPRRLAAEINALGGDAVHTLDLADGNRTTDAAIVELAALEDRIVITKDSDFVDSLLLRGEPSKLLFVTTGNIIQQRTCPACPCQLEPDRIHAHTGGLFRTGPQHTDVAFLVF